MNEEMKFEVNTKALKRALVTVSKILKSKPTVPMLANVHFIAAEDELEIQAVEVTESISVKIEAGVEQPGEFVVDPKLLLGIIEHVDEVDVVFTKDKEKGQVQLQSGWNLTNINVISVEKYPKIPDHEVEQVMTLKKEEFDRLINTTIFACSNESKNPVFTGAKLSIMEGKFTIAASDTRMLAISRCQATAMEKDVSVIVPAKILASIQSLENKAEEIEIRLGKSSAVFVYDNTKIFSNLISGNYPDVEKIIPTRWETTISVDREKLMKAIERVKVFTENGNNTLRIDIDKEQIFLTAVSDKGTGHESVPATVEGEAKKIAFNAKYLNSIMKKVPAESINIMLNTSVSPALIVEKDAVDTRFVLSPIRVA